MASTVKPIIKTIKKRINVLPSFKKDELDREIERLDVAAQTPKERRARQNRRFHMLRNKSS